ncbi:MAG: DUF1223 domain-containing protein [Geminicoccaceae bacterium]
MRTPGLALLLAAGLAGPVAAAPAPVLVELFTSQGCNSCPPADAVLAGLAGRPDVLALAFHVTYWDRLGWPDSFGDERYTDRQRAYAGRLGSSRIYTPQAVVGGRLDVVGSAGGRLEVAIGLVRDDSPAAAAAIDAAGRVTLPPGTGDAEVWAVAYDDAASVAIGGGENAGRTIAYHNIVRWLERLDRQAPVIPLAGLRAAGRSAVAVIAQDPADGHVLALGSRRL